MNFDNFRLKVQEYRRFSGHTQLELAKELNLHPKVLSQKLNNIRNARLSIIEIRLVIKTLIRWQAIQSRNEVYELLELLELKPTVFNEQEWDSPPFNQLEVVTPVTTDNQVNFISKPSHPKGENSPVIRQLTGETVKHNITTPITRLIGRETLLTQLCSLLQRAETRLVTLTGLGGVGKTRLSQEIAKNLLTSFPEGVFFIPLASLNDSSLLLGYIAERLSLKEAKQTTLKDQLVAFFASKSFLLILDNFEHLLAAAPLLLELITGSPGLKLLVTSRIPLSLYGEYEVSVPPLAVASPKSDTSLTRLLQLGAIQLLYERILAIDPSFQLSQETATVASDICSYLDGIPLAIELLAPWSRFFSLSTLLAHLTKQFQQVPNSLKSLNVLTNRSAILPLRHQTLANTLDWSYNLLDASQQLLFNRLAVFNGSFTIKAVEAICYNPTKKENPYQAEDIFTVLLALTRHNMVQYHKVDNDLPRFSLLEILREYALSRLSVSDELEIIQAQHATYYLQMSEQAEPELQKMRRHWVSQLSQEEGNLRASLEWCKSDSARIEVQLKLVSNLWRFWFLAGQLSEGSQYLQTALSQVQNSHLKNSLEYANAVSGLGVLVFYQGDYKRAEALYEQALPLMKKIKHQRGIAACLNNLAMIAQRQENYEAYQKAYDLYAQSLKAMQELNEQVGIGVCLNNLGTMARLLGDYTQARQLLTESLRIRQILNDKPSVGVCLNNLGALDTAEGKYDQARDQLLESVAIRRELGDKEGLGISLRNLGTLLHIQESYNEAYNFYLNSLSILRELGDKYHIVQTLINLGLVAYDQANYSEAQTYYLESLKLCQELKYHKAAAMTHIGLVLLAVKQGELKKALRFCITATFLLEGITFNKNLHLLYPKVYQNLLEYLNTIFDKEFQQGYSTEIKNMTFDTIMEYTLNLI